MQRPYTQFDPDEMPSQQKQHTSNTTVDAIINFVGSGIFSPKSMSYEPISVLLNAPNREERDRLTKQWRDHKLQELNFIGIVAALLTGCLTSTGSWPNILSNGTTTPWGVRTCWYVGIVFGLASILCAADQTIRLHRLSGHRDALMNIRHLLSSNVKGANGKVRPRRWQIYTWQLPVTFLLCSVLIMIAGIWALLWTAALNSSGNKSGDWNSEYKSAVIFTIVTSVVGVVFLSAQITLFSPIGELEEERENSSRDGDDRENYRD